MFSLHLKQQLEAELPGEAAHVRMAPISRSLSSIARAKAEVYRESAVAIILFEDAGEQRIVLIQRQQYEGRHGGQVSFPGGKKDEEDRGLLETAIRESYEEIGVMLRKEEFIGKLTPVFIPVSSFHVEAHVFYLERKPEFRKDEREVEAVFTIRIEELLDDTRILHTDIPLGNNMHLRNVPYFALENKIIWGATALMLNELKEVLGRIKT